MPGLCPTVNALNLWRAAIEILPLARVQICTYLFTQMSYVILATGSTPVAEAVRPARCFKSFAKSERKKKQNFATSRQCVHNNTVNTIGYAVHTFAKKRGAITMSRPRA
jgi:hypothetical protein